MAEKLGLIAGRGLFPLEIAQAARARGARVCAVAIRDNADPALEEFVDETIWCYLGELGKLIESFHAAGVTRAMMAGKVLKTNLYQDLASLHLDAVALRTLASLRDRKDDSILGAIADTLQQNGITLVPQTEWVPELLVEEGVLGTLSVTPAQFADIEFGFPLAKAIGGLDIGQTILVKDRAVMAVEAIEGTDEAILRGGALAGEGVCMVKVAKPQQDLRFDVPAIGTETIRNLARVHAGVLSAEAGKTLIFEREKVLEQADAAGIAVVGVSEEGLAAHRQKRELS